MVAPEILWESILLVFLLFTSDSLLTTTRRHACITQIPILKNSVFEPGGEAFQRAHTVPSRVFANGAPTLTATSVTIELYFWQEPLHKNEITNNTQIRWSSVTSVQKIFIQYLLTFCSPGSDLGCSSEKSIFLLQRAFQLRHTITN